MVGFDAPNTLNPRWHEPAVTTALTAALDDSDADVRAYARKARDARPRRA
jgi:hypothetical protein